jgi:hypothetical protein
MIDLLKLEPIEAERIAYAEGFTMAAELFKRIADLEAERNTLQLEIEDRNNLPVRYFIIDFDLDDGPDTVECDEWDFLKAEGRITYKRHTVRENGVDQICLTKGMDS